MNIEIYENILEYPSDSDDTIIFNSKKWLEVLQESFGYKTLHLIFKEKERKIFISGSIINLGWFKIFYSNVPYGGFYGDLSFFEKIVPIFEEQLRNYGINRIYVTKNYFCPFPELQDYKNEIAYQTILFFDNDGIKNYHLTYKHNNRRQVKKAIKEGLVVQEVSGNADLKKYYTMYSSTIKRKKGFQYWNKSFFDIVPEKLPEHYSVLYALYHNEPTAGIMLIKSKDVLHYFIGASNEQYLNKRPNDFLIYNAIEKALMEGYKSFDFMLTDINDKSLLWFKEKWGSRTFVFNKFKKDITMPWKSKIFDLLYKVYSNSTVKQIISWCR